MKLGIISDCHHYYDSLGRLCTLTPVARQFERWAQMFESVTICAPLLPGTPTPSHQSAYEATNIRLLSVQNAGGNTIQAKITLAKTTFSWWHSLQNLIRMVDAVHIRCPNNISILGLMAVHQTKLLRHAVYTGSWTGNYPGEPLTYRWQRFFLTHLFRGPVGVYGTFRNQPTHIVPTFSPTYSIADWEMESLQVHERLESLLNLKTQKPQRQIRLITVGKLSRHKNQKVIVQAIAELKRRGIDCRLDILGDGEEQAELRTQVHDLEISHRVFFHGYVAQNTVREFYRTADFVIQAPLTEGFGKVPVEAFFHGCIPIISDVDVSTGIVGDRDRGRHFSARDSLAIANHIEELSTSPREMARLITNGREYAKTMTLEAWQIHIRDMLNHYWQTELEIREVNEQIIPA